MRANLASIASFPVSTGHGDINTYDGYTGSIELLSQHAACYGGCGSFLTLMYAAIDVLDQGFSYSSTWQNAVAADKCLYDSQIPVLYGGLYSMTYQQEYEKVRNNVLQSA